MKIIADDKIPFLKGVLEPYAEVVYLPGNAIEHSSLGSAEVLITRSITSCNKKLLRNSKVRIIATATIGMDHINLDYCTKEGIKVTNAKGCNAAAVEQYVTSTLFALSRNEDSFFKEKTLGIIGVGAVGSRVSKMAKALGMQVLLNDPPRCEQEDGKDFSSILDIQEQADIVSLHVPLTFSGKYPTHHLANAEFFKGFRKPVCFINSSRGGVVDSVALKFAIKNGQVNDAVLDVFENEPNIDTELLNLITLGTPHIAGYSFQGKARATSMVVQSLSRFYGWDLDNWFPDLESGPVIKKDCKGLSDFHALQQIFMEAYPIGIDDQQLRNHPANFEKLRRGYTFRNDNEAITIEIKKAGKELITTLKQLGFKIKEVTY